MTVKQLIAAARKQFRRYSVKHLFSLLTVLLIASMTHYLFSFSHEGWIIWAAFLVSQTTIGTPLRQGLIHFAIIISALTIGSAMASNLNLFLLDLMTGIIFVLSGYWVFINRPLPYRRHYLSLLFLLVVFICLLLPSVSYYAYLNRLFDTVLGAFIGIGVNAFVFPGKLGEEFGTGILPVLRLFETYTKKYIDVVSGMATLPVLNENIIEIENALQQQSSIYPEWVYEVGFNRGLRAGFRFFLLNIERLSDNLISLGFLLSRLQDEQMLDAISTELTIVMRNNQALLHALIEYFEQQQLRSLTIELTDDVTQLEVAAQQQLPAHLELLQMAPSQVIMTAMVRNMRELRQLLLSLVMALPTERSGILNK